MLNEIIDWSIILGMIFGGCCSNVWTLEILLANLPKSTLLITFSQFLLVSLEGIPRFLSLVPTLRRHPSLRGYIPKQVQTKQPMFPYCISLKPTRIPKYHWFLMVIMFWSVSVLNNLALDYNIDMILHIIFKSCSLLINMLLGHFVGKRYAVRQVIGVISVSVGVLICTILSSSAVSTLSMNTSDPLLLLQSKSEWKYGITLMSISLIISAFLGLYQEHVYSKYGKQWKEGLFYTHFFGLPFFCFMITDLISQMKRVINSGVVVFIWLALNSITQLFCIAGVHKLSTIASSLTVNLILTFRKFISLILSIAYFQKEFTFGHFVGASLVFIGTILYSSVTSSAKKEPIKSISEPITTTVIQNATSIGSSINSNTIKSQRGKSKRAASKKRE